MKRFIDWIDITHGPGNDRPSEVHRIALAIARAGHRGLSRQEIGQRFDLPGRLVAELLNSLVSTGQATAAAEENGEMTYRSVGWTQAIAAYSAEEERKIRRLD